MTEKYDRRTPPFSIEPLLKQFNVAEVRQRLLTHDARLIQDGGRLTIEVNSAFPGVRQRLSAAHELAHLIVSEYSPISGDRGNESVIESLCDHVAGMLLVPEWALHSYFQQSLSLGGWQSGIRCSTVLEAAAVFDVSVDVMARRIFQDLSLSPATVAVIWRYGPSSVNPAAERALRVASAWRSAANRRFIPRNKTAPPDSVIFTAYQEGGVFCREEELSLGAVKGRFTVEAMGFQWFSMRRGARPARAVLSLLTS
ncbi:MAG TPA: ImmA/IrrE family metallo-endopeptidase [Terriglobales bacterium]|nr:ImmA/IrrE family metallo-endopeptidase [Terriglobales bacterium]